MTLLQISASGEDNMKNFHSGTHIRLQITSLDVLN